jgi:hypothetical protein
MLGLKRSVANSLRFRLLGCKLIRGQILKNTERLVAGRPLYVHIAFCDTKVFFKILSIYMFFVNKLSLTVRVANSILRVEFNLATYILRDF